MIVNLFAYVHECKTKYKLRVLISALNKLRTHLT